MLNITEEITIISWKVVPDGEIKAYDLSGAGEENIYLEYRGL